MTVVSSTHQALRALMVDGASPTSLAGDIGAPPFKSCDTDLNTESRFGE